MSGKDKTSGMKSAYELALERMEARGIAPPRQDSLSDETRQAIAEARRVTEAKLAELEILHHDKLRKLEDGLKIEEQEEFYRLEKERLTSEGERKVEKLRGGA
jgi:hypothetical protein